MASAEAEILTETEVAASACGVGRRENTAASKAGASNNVDGSSEGFRQTKDPFITTLAILTVLTDLPIHSHGRPRSGLHADRWIPLLIKDRTRCHFVRQIRKEKKDAWEGMPTAASK